MLRVMLYVQEHLDEELSLEHLAGVACFSPFHFHRIFRGITGEPVKEYVRRLRMERAARRLKTGGEAVVRVALDAGFDSHEGFTRAFHARFGQAPSAWREGHAARVVRLPARRAAFVRHVGPYGEVGEAWGRLFAAAGRAGLFGPGMELFGILHDDPEITEPAKLRYDAAVLLGREFAGSGEVGVVELPAREYATCRHVGPYELLGETYAALCGQWLPWSGREPGDAPGLEFYRNDPRNAAASELITDIFVPLR
jgi:AraC family transcriptional regulator